MKKSLLMLSFVALSAGALVSCGGNNSNPNQLNVICLDKGYGKEWIEVAKTRWEAANPDYKINLQAVADAPALIKQHLASSKNQDDLYISVGADWKTYASQGKFANLDSFIDETVDGVKVKEKLLPEYRNSIYHTMRDGSKHTYRLPWTSGTGGIYYNHELLKEFFEGDVELPETFDDLLTLINTIKDAELPVAGSKSEIVKPFVFTGQNTDYFDYTVLTWWGQLAGKTKIDNFLKYESADNFDASISDSAYSALKEATNMWNQIFSDDDNYVKGSKDLTSSDAQSMFLQGKAVMMMNSDWLYNELTKTAPLPASMDLRIMNTPVASGADDSNIAYCVGEDQYIAIPASSTKQELAKSFIKTIISDEGCKTFLNKAHGMLAYSFNKDSFQAENTYVQSLLDYRTHATTTFTNFSDSKMYANNKIDIWGQSAYRPFDGLLKKTYSTVDAAFDTITSEVKRNWGEWSK